MSYRIQFASLGELGVSFFNKPCGNDNLFTVLIGKNGSGKSRVLSSITNTLCSIYVGNKLLKRDIGTISKHQQDDNNILINIHKDNKGCEIKVNGRSILFDLNKDASHICPKKIIAASTSPFNKFPGENIYFTGLYSDSVFYHYYGVDGNYKNKALLSLIERVFFSSADGFLTKNKLTLVNLLGFLGLEDNVEIHFRIKHGIHKFMSYLSDSNIKEFMNYVSTASQRDLSYLQKKYDLTYDRLRDAFIILNEYCSKQDDSRIIKFYLNLSRMRLGSKDREFISAIKILSDIGIFNIHDVIVSRRTNREEDGWKWWEEPTESFSISDASSGQQCMLLNILGVASSIEDNSLILIDEPEISLHPEWQETYIELLTESFIHIKGCHFIIATHSPQIVSNLKGNNCFVSNLENHEVLNSFDIKNKSVDFQLATLFDAPGNDNEYLKRIAVNVLSALSNGSYTEEFYGHELNLLIKNKDKIEDGDNVKRLIELAVEVLARVKYNESN
ncbi:TPA: ATP-binding protein [Klebsiella quasipneumoniae]|nr:ATP-binding protein [Klebsiella quasipneumoniae]